MVIVLATETMVRGFKPGRGRWISKGDKIVFLKRGSRAVGPISQYFTAF
jgi:hypothetical protein